MNLNKCNVTKTGSADWQVWIPEPEYDEAGWEVGPRGTTYHPSHAEACEHVELYGEVA